MMNPAELFKKNNYIVVKNFIDKQLTDFFYEYVKLEAVRCDSIQTILGEKNKEKNVWGTFEDVWGSFNDGHIKNAYSKYGDLTFDTLLKLSVDKMKQATGLDLLPEYSYHRFYVKGCHMARHKDRESCEISVTLCLGFDGSNLKDKDYKWPMWIKSNDGVETPIYLEPGDAIIYRGYELEHWREEFLGLNHAQVFLHYNDKNGPYKIEYDDRLALGLPSEFREAKYKKVY